jgi:two-component system, OmpR family, response regulator
VSKILILDDDVNFGFLTKRRLERVGMDVQLHHEAPLAMDSLLRGRFDLVILDVKMPGLTGTDVIKLIRSSSNAHVKVMFYSSSDTHELRRLAEQHHAQGFLTKTASTQELEFRVRELLAEPRSSRKSPERR